MAYHKAELEKGGSTITVDSALSSTSENPVQNKVINSALSGKRTTGAYDDQNDTVTFTTGDVSSDASATYWTDNVGQLTSGSTFSTLLNRISTMIKNVRYLKKCTVKHKTVYLEWTGTNTTSFPDITFDNKSILFEIPNVRYHCRVNNVYLNRNFTVSGSFQNFGNITITTEYYTIVMTRKTDTPSNYVTKVIFDSMTANADTPSNLVNYMFISFPYATYV